MERRYFNSYLQIEKDSKIPVHIFFMIDISDSKTPFGVFERSARLLLENIHSRSEDCLFWDISDLNEIKLYN